MDFSGYKYPKTEYNAPVLYSSHSEFLQASALRYAINTQLHFLSLADLQKVHDITAILSSINDLKETFSGAE